RDLERDVHLTPCRLLDGRVDRRVAIADFPVVEPNARDVATEFVLVEVVLVLERRRVAEQTEGQEQQAPALGRLCRKTLLEVVQIGVFDAGERELPDFRRFALLITRVLSGGCR